MNKTLDTELANLISKTTQGIDSSLLFAQKELPAVIEQLITWKIYQYSISLVIAIFIFFLIFIWGKRIKRIVDMPEFEDIEGVLFAITFVIGGVVGTILFFDSFFNIIQLITAPKIWLIEYASTLIK